MKHLLWIIIVCAVGYGEQYYIEQKYEPQLSDAQATVAQVQKERDKTLADLTKTQDELATLKAAQAQLIAKAQFPNAPQASAVIVMSSDPKKAIRDQAIGEKLDKLVTAAQTFTGVTIKAIDPSGIDILHDNGAAHVRFSDLDQSWRDRFQYDPAEEADYLAHKAADSAKADADLQAQLAAQAQAAPATPMASPPQPAASPQQSKHQEEIQALQKQIADLQQKHDAWVSGHVGWPGHPWHHGDIPDEISSAAITDLQE